MDPIFLIVLLVAIIMMGGGSFPFVNQDMTVAHYPTVSTEYHCEEVLWTVPAKVTNGIFSGTAELTCNFKALDGGGIGELTRHMEAKIPQEVKQVHSGPNNSSYFGMPSKHFELSYDASSDKYSTTVRGETHVASDSKTRLRNIFISSNNRGAVKDLMTEVDVTATAEPDWYSARIVSSPRLQKPWGLSAKKFYYYIKDNTEIELKKKAHTVVHDVAQHT